MADTLLATQLRKGMIIKLDNELYRIHDRQHVTPGNLRGFVRLKMRNLRNQSMSEHKARSEDVIERATLDEKEMFREAQKVADRVWHEARGLFGDRATA